MKYVLLVLLATSSLPVFAETLSVKLICSVDEVKGHMGSFIPPKKGSRIQVDTSQDAITDLQFQDGSYISTLEPLQKAIDPTTQDYISHFKANQYETTRSVASLAMRVGKFSSGKNETVYSVKNTIYNNRENLRFSRCWRGCDELRAFGLRHLTVGGF